MRKAAGQAQGVGGAEHRGEVEEPLGERGAEPPRHRAFSKLSANTQEVICAFLEKSLPQENKVTLPSPY